MKLILLPDSRTGLERVGLGSDAGRLVTWFQKLLFVCRFYDLKFEINRRKIRFSRSDGSELEPINGGYEWDFHNLTDLVEACDRIIGNRSMFDSREFDPEDWKWDVNQFFFNEI